jgi:hypothetical protein
MISASGAAKQRTGALQQVRAVEQPKALHRGERQRGLAVRPAPLRRRLHIFKSSGKETKGRAVRSQAAQHGTAQHGTAQRTLLALLETQEPG